MWYPNDKNSLNISENIPNWSNRADWKLYPTHQDLSEIYNSLATILEGLNIKPPHRIEKYGQIENNQGYNIIYSLNIDNDGDVYMTYTQHHKQHTYYKQIKKNGTIDDLEMADGNDSIMRLLGVADNEMYKHDGCIGNEEFEFFWEKESPFSQWYKSKFYADGLCFVTAEQYMMFHKAILFGDIETAAQIMRADDAEKQKKLGRKVKNFDEDTWAKHSIRIVYEANRYKFTQNTFLFETLISKENKIIVEASPYDKTWGVGLAADNPLITSPKQWPGKNQLGYILTMLRDDLKYYIEHNHAWIEERIEDIPLNDEQYRSLKRGFAPDWDFRYEPRYLNGWHYFCRSGYWVKKFKYELKEDRLYHLVQNYTSTMEQGRNILVESFIDGYYSPQIWSHEEKLKYFEESNKR